MLYDYDHYEKRKERSLRGKTNAATAKAKAKPQDWSGMRAMMDEDFRKSGSKRSTMALADDPHRPKAKAKAKATAFVQ